MPLIAGARIGQYEIVSVIGAGGMGEVYRAKDTTLDRHVALKILPDAVAGDPDALARFEREARTVASLNHPNIVVLYSIEDVDGIRFLTMELVEGEGLDRHVAPGGLPVARVVDVGIALADALDAAHSRRVVHRDLKPANVMLTREGRVKVLDFGLAKAAADRECDRADATTVVTPVSTPGQVVGTVPYMAPEQIRGEVVDARTDLFALGILLYELATGHRPFTGATSADVISSILRDDPRPVQAVRADMPADVARIVGRCLEKDPGRRPQTAKDVRNELELVRRALQVGPVQARPGRGRSAAPVRAMPSIAVLPFANRGRGEEDEYFADGITEDVIAQLCKVRTLKVISRSSIMPFKDREVSLSDIASSLQVASVLEGTVRRVGDRVRIVARLTETASGAHLWAETFDRQLTDIFAIQSEVALQIATALKAELAPSEGARIRREPTHDVQAYEDYLRGRHALVRYTSEDLLRSIEYFESALARDPEFALAHVGVALAHTELGEGGRLDRARAGARAMSAAARAVAVDPELGEAHCALAYARMVFEFDWDGAEQGFRRALDLSPGGADVYDLYGRMCASLERYSEAIVFHQRAYELDPLTHLSDLANTYLRAGRVADAARSATDALARDSRSARLRATLGWALFRQGRIEEGLSELDRAVMLAPTEDVWRAQRGQALALAGRTDEARAVLRRLEDPGRLAPASPYHLAYVYTGLGDLDRAMDLLERAFVEGTGAIHGIKGSFLLTPLREHPRFIALLEKMRLA